MTRQTRCNSCNSKLTVTELAGSGTLICHHCRRRSEEARGQWHPLMQWENGGNDGLRLASAAPVPWDSPRVSLIAITAAGGIEATRTLGGKRKMLAQAGDDDMLLAAWPGQRYQAVFIVDDRQAALKAITREQL